MGPQQRRRLPGVARLPKGWAGVGSASRPRLIYFSDIRKERSLGTWYDKLVRFLRAEDGPTSVEYAIVLAFILMVCLASISTLSAGANTTFTTESITLSSAGP